MTKKKIIALILFMFCLLTFTACGSNNVDLSKHVIEKRENLFVASDNLYSVSFSTGTRENKYNFDGVVNEMVPFGILTLTRNNNTPLANDTYSFIVTINDKTYSGFLENNNNSCSADLEVNTIGEESINVSISFTGYTFNKNLENISKDFQVDSNSALKVTQKELKKDIKNLISDSNVKFEVVMKIMKDYSSENVKKYYWYVGIISTNGDTMGVLIDANNGEVIAKKV